MASILDAYECTLKEAFSGIKLILWGIPVGILYSTKGIIFGLYLPIFSIIFFGFLTQIMINSVKKTGAIIPSINFIQMGFSGMMAILAMSAYAIVGSLLYYLCTFINIPNEVWGQTFRIVMGLLGVAMPITALLIYIRKQNIIDVFNMKKFFQGYWHIFMTFSCMLIKFALISLPIFGFIWYMFNLFIGFENSFWSYVLGLVTVFFCILGANYLAQTSDEVWTFIEKAENEARERAMFQRIR